MGRDRRRTAYIYRNQASYLDWNIRLTGDIDMTGYDWVPIADEATVFSGIFDGREHRIEGLTIDGGALHKDRNKSQLAASFHMSRATFYRHMRLAEKHLAFVLSDLMRSGF
ncbi:hypothetical protein AK95_28535 [Paenibacillus sp. LC231]|uniref:hypothetical protein n=1 Tax=Paenibacillus sp. LC231 TaxID=1120679 RepID=UPI0008DDCDFC|nr:hypothetical protein [Paenibacillus sp. LC231]OIB01380.1 hypothetical protein AK95_28535 [Paenibacillus sp. LC231]